jgi:TatA/E family protein of Tat protein translocase
MSPVFAIIDAPIIAGIVVVALILFGAERLPKLARSMGQAKKEFEAASAGKPAPPEASDVEPQATPPSVPSAPPTTPPPSAPPSAPQ